MTTSVSIDRSGMAGSPAALVIGLYGASVTYWLPADGLSRADFLMRRTYAPDSAYLPGKQQLTAVADIGALPLAVYVQADTTAHLETAITDLTAALSQWSYPITVTIDGQSRTYQADGEIPQWGGVDAGMMRAFMSRASVVIPVNPS